MPQALLLVGRDWTLLTGSDVECFTVQMRPERKGQGGRLFLASGTADRPPPPKAGLFLDCCETSGVAGYDLAGLDPGGEGSRLWARFSGGDECAVWCSWRTLLDGGSG